MKIAKPSDEDKAFFTELFGDRAELEIKPMFGNLAAFALSNQQMCAGLFGPAVGLRLSEADRDELLATEGAGPFGPAERPMKEYVAIPSAWRSGELSAADAWIDRSITHTESLAPKKKKPKKKKPKKQS